MDGAYGPVSIVSDQSEIRALGDEHPEDRIYQQKVQDISKKYAFFRRTLGDGNCFYRALSFAYLESMVGNNKGIKKWTWQRVKYPRKYSRPRWGILFHLKNGVMQHLKEDIQPTMPVPALNDLVSLHCSFPANFTFF